MCGETFLNLFSRLSITIYDTGTLAGGRFMNLVGPVIVSGSFKKRKKINSTMTKNLDVHCVLKFLGLAFNCESNVISNID